MYNVKIIPQARKDLDKYKDKIFEDIKAKLLSLKNDPRPYCAEKLTKEEGYRIRVRDIRILYRIDDKKREVIII